MQCSSTVYGISCQDGHVTWINRGPQPLTANGAMLYANAALLPSPSYHSLPRVLFQVGDQLAVCRDARKIGLDEQASSPEEARVAGAVETMTNSPIESRTGQKVSPTGGPRPAHLQRVPPDPRLIRRTTWSPDEGERDRQSKITVWGTFLSLSLTLLPGWMLSRMVQRRRWGMGSLLLLVALAALLLTILRVPGPSNFEPTMGHSRSTTRILTAVMYLPIPVFTLLLVHLAGARRWHRFGLGVAGVLLFATFIVVISLVSDFRRLGPDQHPALTDWDIPLCFGYYAAGWLATLIVVDNTVSLTARSIQAMVRSQDDKNLWLRWIK